MFVSAVDDCGGAMMAERNLCIGAISDSLTSEASLSVFVPTTTFNDLFSRYRSRALAPKSL